jgi:hypothetical protein
LLCGLQPPDNDQELPTMTRAAFDLSVSPHEREEGTYTKAIEHYSSMVPSGTYLSLAFASVGLSLGLYAIGRKQDAIFVGHWAPTILLMGVYNKMVKLHGSD